jgi:3-hydroxyacyl-CoA dehydrogenase/enoyl-CoA hydratase/3-hydroxybutyryl-CoA epimerase
MPDHESARRFGIVGAGTIGSTIARLFSDREARVVVVAPRPGAVSRAEDMLRLAYQSDVDHGRITRAESEAKLRNIHLTPCYAGLADVECVIESVTEDVQAKQEVIAQIEACVSPDCLIGSNTSSIPITTVAARAIQPERIVGTHYFWPAQRYRLVEIVPGAATSEETLRRTLAMVRWQGKVPLLAGDRPGFFTTRILLVYLNEALALVAEGASIESVENAMRAFGWAMGPFRVMDAVGIEILRDIHESVSPHFGERLTHLDRLSRVLMAGHVGRKGAKGFYLYPGGTVVDRRSEALIGREPGRVPSPADLSTRPIWQFINEISRCLSEGVVSSVDDADRGAMLGIGWPRYQGGPLEYARRVGFGRIAEQLSRWEVEHGPRFTPDQFLTRQGLVGAEQAPPLVETI